MNLHTFHCIDGHTGGNPVRLVASGAPNLRGETMSARRQDFLARFDWIRTGLMFEPRGHDMMSGGFLYPPANEDADIGILFIETSGCLPMCGHGTIGMVTFGLEQGLITPKNPGRVRLDVPAGIVEAVYQRERDRIAWVRIRNVASYLSDQDIEIDLPEFGRLRIDIAYGGNFYAIIDPQPNFPGLEAFSADQIIRLSPIVRRLTNEAVELVHPEDTTIRGVSHIQWTGAPRDNG